MTEGDMFKAVFSVSIEFHTESEISMCISPQISALRYSLTVRQDDDDAPPLQNLLSAV